MNSVMRGAPKLAMAGARTSQWNAQRRDGDRWISGTQVITAQPGQKQVFCLLAVDLIYRTSCASPNGLFVLDWFTIRRRQGGRRASGAGLTDVQPDRESGRGRVGTPGHLDCDDSTPSRS